MLLRCLGWRKRKRDDYTLSYADALAETASESIEAIVRKRRILLARFVARIGEERLPQRVMFGELVGGKGYSGGQEKDWLVHLKEDTPVFGMKFEGWRKAAQKTGRCVRPPQKETPFADSHLNALVMYLLEDLGTRQAVVGAFETDLLPCAWAHTCLRQGGAGCLHTVPISLTRICGTQYLARSPISTTISYYTKRSDLPRLGSGCCIAGPC